MKQVQHDPLTLMRWSDFLGRLETSRSTPATSAEFRIALEASFGAEGRHRLEALIDRARSIRADHAPIGNVVLVHDMMCSHLITCPAGGQRDPLWMNLARLSRGDLPRLRLDPEGRIDADPSLQITADGVIKSAYAALLTALHARWNVQPFAYDWRKDLDTASDGLADFIRLRFGDQPVHLVGHGMGGIVCRNLIQRHPQLWQSMRDRNLRRGGRLILLGTPNYGTFLATQLLSGQSEVLWALDSADPHHGLLDVLEAFSSFVSIYQMLPAPDKVVAGPALYQPQTWGTFPVSTRLLEHASALRTRLSDPATVDPERLIYIAGYGHRTPSGLQVPAPGELKHRFSFQGDGITSLEHGPIPGVPTWYVIANHLELVSRPRVLWALDDLLCHGRTLNLTRRPLPIWMVQASMARWIRSFGRVWLNFDIRDIVRQIGLGTADDTEIYRAERVLIETALGERRVMKRLWELEQKRLPERLLARMVIS